MTAKKKVEITLPRHASARRTPVRLTDLRRIRHELAAFFAVSAACQPRVSSGSGSGGTIGGMNPLAPWIADPALSVLQSSSRRRVVYRAPNRPLCSGRPPWRLRKSSEPQPSRANERS